MSTLEPREDRSIKGKTMLCDIAAHKIKKTIMRDIKEAEKDIGMACALFHKKYEEKTGRPIVTMSDFERVTKEFSKLPRNEMMKLIEAAKAAEVEGKPKLKL